MKYLLTFACVIICSPSAGLAQPAAKSQAPETLLSADVLAFLRYDGYEPHKKAYDQTTLAKVMKDDLGEFLDYLVEFSRDTLLSTVKRDDDDKDAKNAKPEQKEKAAAEFNKFMEYFWRHGILVGLEISEGPIDLGRFPFFPVPDQATIIFPEGGQAKNRAVVFSFLHLLADLAGTPVIEKKTAKRTFFKTKDDLVVWWQEGDHVVVRLGLLASVSAEQMRQTIEVIEGKKPNLTSTPLYQKLAKFKSYETDIRGLFDLEKFIDLVRAPDERGNRLGMILEGLQRHLLLHHLGANGLHGVTFHMGYSGKFQRSTVMLHVAEKKQRTGLLRVLTSATIDPAQLQIDKLPPLPPDTAYLSVNQLDWLACYDYAMKTARIIALAEALPEGRLPDTSWFDLDALLGLNVRKDLLAGLDSTVVLYNAHSEGPSFLGQGVAIKVKDAKKLNGSLKVLNKALADAMLGVQFEKRVYRGVDMFVLASPRGILPLPVALTYTVHKDWLVIGTFPQSVKGFILRSEGKRKTWQPPSYYPELLAQSLKEGGPKSRLAGIGVIDPQPTMEIGLALLPVFAHFLNTETTGAFDVSKVPSAQSVTEYLYPTVSFFFDDDDALRWENHFSIDLPLEFMAPIIMAGFGRFF